jgi:hypothetical protein
MHDTICKRNVQEYLYVALKWKQRYLQIIDGRGCRKEPKELKYSVCTEFPMLFKKEECPGPFHLILTRLHVTSCS